MAVWAGAHSLAGRLFDSTVPMDATPRPEDHPVLSFSISSGAPQEPLD